MAVFFFLYTNYTRFLIVLQEKFIFCSEFQLHVLLHVDINVNTYTELYRAYSRKEKNNVASPKNLFKVIVYAYMNNIYSSRPIETACKRDINFMYLLEGAFGVLKEDMGFRRFLTRGTANVRTEILLLCLAYNVQKFHNKTVANRQGQFLHEIKVA